jgi:protein ImuB
VYGGLHTPGILPADDVLAGVAREFTPKVEIFHPRLVLMDLHGLGRLWPSPQALGQALIESAARQNVTIPHAAVAWNRVTALLVARARPGLSVISPGQEAAVLAGLPLTLLDLLPEQQERFRRWGLSTLGELAALPAVGLAERLGPAGPRLRRLARGEDEIPLSPTPTPRPFQLALDLDWAVDGLEPLGFLLTRLLEPLCADLHASGQCAASLALELRLADGTLDQRTLHTAAPSAQARTWRTVVLLELESQPPRDAICAITLRAQPTPAREVQFSLFTPTQAGPERLAETLARLHEWTTARRAGSPTLLETHRPQAFAMATFAPPPARASAAPAPHEPRAVLRVFRPPCPAQVAHRQGQPLFVAAGDVRGAVVECAGPWRASGDWWDVAWSREEWDVALADQGVYRLFRDRLTERWFLEGELD